MDLDTLRTCVNADHTCKSIVCRAPEMQSKYDEFCKTVIEKRFFSYKDFILQRVFKRAAYCESYLNKMFVLKRNLSKGEWAFKENDFPYDVDAKHYVLWSDSQNAEMITAQNLIDEFCDGKEHVWFVNDKKTQTVKELFHVHVFIKND